MIRQVRLHGSGAVGRVEQRGGECQRAKHDGRRLDRQLAERRGESAERGDDEHLSRVLLELVEHIEQQLVHAAGDHATA